MAADGDAAAQRLGQADDVGRDAERRGRAAGADGEPGLHLVEGQQRAVPVQQVLEPGEVAVVGRG